MSQAVSRRTLAKGAVWSTPVLMVGAAAQATVTSPRPCPAVPAPSQWVTRVVSGTLGPTGTGSYGWSGDVFTEYQDNQSTTAPLVIETTVTVRNLEIGTRYLLSSPFNWGYGNNNALQSTSQSVAFIVDTTPAATTVYSATTRTAPQTTPGNSTLSGQFTATATSHTFTLRFTISARGTRSANDDVNLTRPAFTKCERPFT